MRSYKFIHCINVYKKYRPEMSQANIFYTGGYFYTSIKNIQVYARIKIFQAETNVYATFMHPYKCCIKYTKSFI
jgi:hypothetical protein